MFGNFFTEFQAQCIGLTDTDSAMFMYYPLTPILSAASGPGIRDNPFLYRNLTL